MLCHHDGSVDARKLAAMRGNGGVDLVETFPRSLVAGVRIERGGTPADKCYNVTIFPGERGGVGMM